MKQVYVADVVDAAGHVVTRNGQRLQGLVDDPAKTFLYDSARGIVTPRMIVVDMGWYVRDVSFKLV